jgi:hypothetical protein
MTPRPCLCGCGRQFSRPLSMPLCVPATQRARRVFRELARGLDTSEYQRLYNRFWIDQETVRAALAGNLDEVRRRVQFRADHGLYADPDRAPIAVGA